MSTVDWLAGKGFDIERLRFGLRTALACCLALVVAWQLALEHPQWSAMTVWAASQPVRQLLVEKSLYRVAGTLVGTAVGLLLLLATGDSPLWLVIGLSLWVGLCAGAGNALHSMISYATLLSGYSASMVALLGTTSSMNLLALGLDRLLTVLVGVMVALLVGLLFTPKASRSELEERGRRSTSRVLHHLAARLGHHESATAHDPNELLADIADLEEQLEPSAAGSRRARHSARSHRTLLAAQVAALLWMQRTRHEEALPAEAGRAVSEAALAVDRAAPLPELVAHLTRARGLAQAHPALAEVLDRLADAMAQRLRFQQTGSTARDSARRHVVRHRDWVYARHAMLRTTSLLLLTGLAWVATGWPAGAYVMLGTSVMVTLFSTFENPAWIMRHILMWQSVGAAAALACRWLIWPAAGAEWQLVVSLMPFILMTVIPFSHRRTMNGSVDAAMILLLLSQPALPLTGTFGHSLAIALAVVAGPLLAFLAFRLIFPTNARRRRARLKGMMLDELQAMADRRRPATRAALWQARLHHRVMKLVHWTNRNGEPTHGVVDGSLAVLEIGTTLEALQRLRQSAALTPWFTRCIDVTLRRVARLARDPEKAARALGRLGRVLRRHDPALAEQVDGSAAQLSANLAFFREPARHGTQATDEETTDKRDRHATPPPRKP